MSKEVEVEQAVAIFVPLFKEEYKGYISYSPKSKKSEYKTGYPIGIGNYVEDWENEYWVIRNYDKVFWVKAAKCEEDKPGDIMVTLNEVNTEDYQTIYLHKKTKDGKTSFVSKNSDGKNAPKDVAGKKYFINLVIGKADKPNNLLLILNEAGDSQGGGWSKEEISFVEEAEVDF